MFATDPQGIYTEGVEFQGRRGFEIPESVERWEFSTTFGRWGAVVIFSDGTRLFTYPRADYAREHAAREEHREKTQDQLCVILGRFVSEFRTPWPGGEWGKPAVGNGIIGALLDTGFPAERIPEIMKGQKWKSQSANG